MLSSEIMCELAREEARLTGLEIRECLVQESLEQAKLSFSQDMQDVYAERLKEINESKLKSEALIKELRSRLPENLLSSKKYR